MAKPDSDKTHIVVLEADWSPDGGSDQPVNGRVGPAHTYRDVFAGAASLIGIDLDRAGFASKQGFSPLARRFFRVRDARYLVVGGHGGKGKLHAVAGAFDPYKALAAAAEACDGAKKTGLLLASCELGNCDTKAKQLLDAGTFEWIGGYRNSSYYLSAVLVELRFWSLYLGGLSYQKSAVGKRSVRLSEPQDPIQAALFTYLDMSAAVGTRFDVRAKSDHGVVSALEVFQVLALRKDIIEGPLAGAGGNVTVTKASELAADEYEGTFHRMWTDSWEWEIQT